MAVVDSQAVDGGFGGWGVVVGGDGEVVWWCGGGDGRDESRGAGGGVEPEGFFDPGVGDGEGGEGGFCEGVVEGGEGVGCGGGGGGAEDGVVFGEEGGVERGVV